MKILLIEKAIEMRTALSRLLTKADYAVTSIKEGEEGRRIAVSEDFDLILLSATMYDPHECEAFHKMNSGPDGWEILRGIRAEKVRTPVLLMTSFPEDRERARGAFGPDDLLFTPFPPDLLLEKVDELIRRSGRRIEKGVE